MRFWDSVFYTLYTCWVLLPLGLALLLPGLCAAALDKQRGAYVTRPHSDKKALQREREKKIAAGRKPDGCEEYDMEQTQ